MSDERPGDAPDERRVGSDPDAAAERQVDEGRRRVVQWLWRLPVIAVAAGGAYGAYEAVRVHFRKLNAEAEPEFADRPETLVGALGAFAADWDALAFELPGGAEGEQVPAVAVRLPGPIPGGLEVSSGVGAASAHLAAFSRVCTHQQCIVSLNLDVQAINFGFNYQTDSPALTCPCHLSVFDPQQGGKAVSGPAVQPLPRVRLEQRGDRLYATGLERG